MVDYAWGDPGDVVTAGEKASSPARPKEESLGWLALGATGLTAWRQTRRTWMMASPVVADDETERN